MLILTNCGSKKLTNPADEIDIAEEKHYLFWNNGQEYYDLNDYWHDFVWVLPDDLSYYDIIFIELGLNCGTWGGIKTGIVNSEEQRLLINFLDAGSSLYIEGSNVGIDHQGSDFLDHLGVVFVGSDESN